jgi:hypothetical protein
VLKESRAIGTPIVISDLTSTYTRVYDLLFSSLFVRATTNMSYKFKTLTDPLVSGDRIHVWLEHFYYEYVILPLNLDCQINGSPAVCTRIGKRVMITSGSIAANTEVTILISNLVTPNYKECNIK